MKGSMWENKLINKRSKAKLEELHKEEQEKTSEALARMIEECEQRKPRNKEPKLLRRL